jgi:predicted transcriptional regulator
MIRNSTLLKRIDDLQQTIHDLHIRLQESNLIHTNLVRSNDHLRSGADNQHAASSLLSSSAMPDTLAVDIDALCSRWKAYPGQEARNAPNLRKQALMLALLQTHDKLRAAELFQQSGTGAVTGARYVAALKKAGLIEYTGARKKGHYRITPAGRAFVLSGEARPAAAETNTLLQGIPLDAAIPAQPVHGMDQADL